jgi:hypothetical protein
MYRLAPRVLASALALFALCLLAALAPSLTASAQQTAQEEEGAWFCPMHPDVTGAAPGQCTKCAMRLIRGNPFDTAEYLLDLTTQPQAIIPGRPFRIRSEVRHPATRLMQNQFELVHDKPYHLFVISEDMTVFEHLHPEQQADGSWALDVTVPKGGYYRVISDFVPTGGSPQFLSRTVIVPGSDGYITDQMARLQEDVNQVKRVGGITAAVTLGPERFLAGSYGHIQFALTDTQTGEPVRDLQPYLGAFGHSLIMHEQMRHSVHSHPTTLYEGTAVSQLGGPMVEFEGYLPVPGLYRAWTQFMRNGEVTTIPFTFRVWSLDEVVGLR